MQAGPSRKSGHKSALSPPKASDTPELTPDNSTSTTSQLATPPLATPRLAAHPLNSQYKTKDILEMPLPGVHEVIDLDDWGFPDPTLTYEWNPDWDELCGRKPPALHTTETRRIVGLSNRRSRSPHQASESVAPAADPRQLAGTSSSDTQRIPQAAQSTASTSVDASRTTGHATNGSRIASPYSTPASSSSRAAALIPANRVPSTESGTSAVPSSSRQTDAVVRQVAPTTAIPSVAQTSSSTLSTGTSSTSTGSSVRSSSSSSVSDPSGPSTVVATVPEVHVERWNISTASHALPTPVNHHSAAVTSGNTSGISTACISNPTPALYDSPAIVPNTSAIQQNTAADVISGRALSTASANDSSATLSGNHLRNVSTSHDDVSSATAQHASHTTASSTPSTIALPCLPAAISSNPIAISIPSRANDRTVDPPSTASASATSTEFSALSTVPTPAVNMSPRAFASTSRSPMVDSAVPQVGIHSMPRPQMPQSPAPVANHQASGPQHEQARRVQTAATAPRQYIAVNLGPHPQDSSTATRNAAIRARIIASTPPEKLRQLQHLYLSGTAGWQRLNEMGALRFAQAFFGPLRPTAARATTANMSSPQVSQQSGPSPTSQPMSPMYSSQPQHGASTITRAAASPAMAPPYSPHDAAASPAFAPGSVHMPGGIAAQPATHNGHRQVQHESQVASGSGSTRYVYASPAATAAQYDRQMHQWARQQVQQPISMPGRVQNTPSELQSPVQYARGPQPNGMLPQVPMQVQQQTSVPTPQQVLNGSYAGQRAVLPPQYYRPSSVQGIPRQFAQEAIDAAAASTPGSVYQPGSSYNSPSFPPQTPLVGSSYLYPGTPSALRDPGGTCKPCGDLRLSNREEAVKHLRQVHKIDHWPKNEGGKTTCQFNPEHGPIKDMMRHILSSKHLGGMDQCPRCGTWVGWRDDRHECIAKRKRDDEDEPDDETQRKRMR
ncbi:hypothetical protein EIP86_004895 [Pleurotus ostreatoroseus]|nr:hypothetical protein EIP86_004895 [Pleurotus ostreatoroseus]